MEFLMTWGPTILFLGVVFVLASRTGTPRTRAAHTVQEFDWNAHWDELAHKRVCNESW